MNVALHCWAQRKGRPQETLAARGFLGRRGTENGPKLSNSSQTCLDYNPRGGITGRELTFKRSEVRVLPRPPNAHKRRPSVASVLGPYPHRVGPLCLSRMLQSYSNPADYGGAASGWSCGPGGRRGRPPPTNDAERRAVARPTGARVVEWSHEIGTCGPCLPPGCAEDLLE